MLEFLYNPWTYVVFVVNMGLALSVTLHAVLHKRETATIIAWVGLAWLAPFLGAITYYCFGINRIQRKAEKLEIGEGFTCEVPELEDEDFRLRDEIIKVAPNLPGLSNLGLNVTGRRVLPGNSVTLLRDGDEAYPAMLEAIDGAKKSVALLSYIFDSDEAGEKFLVSLKAAQERGVEVRVLIDFVGSRYSKPSMIDRLKEEGVNVAGFLPTRTFRLFNYANLRNHRKILVVDGKVGFTGGTNIRAGHCMNLNPDFPVQCAHFKIVGPVVAHLQEVFAVDWDFAAGEALGGDLWFPKIERSGDYVGARGIPDGPDDDFDNISEVILGALATATRHVRITSPYFIPDPPILRALNVAARRGLQVDIVLPSNNNVPIVDWASTDLLHELIERGCNIYRSAPPFDHTKLMTIDGVWSLIGSTNWDPRSLRLNFEFNVECYGISLAEELDKLIDGKIAGGRKITLEEIETRPLFFRLRDGLARLASPYL